MGTTSHAMGTFAKIVVLPATIVLAGCSSGATQEDGANVAEESPRFVFPRDYVPTPFGLMHEACVISVATDERVFIEEERIERADGSSRPMPACGHPAFDYEGLPIVLPHVGYVPPHGNDSPLQLDGLPLSAIVMAGAASPKNSLDGFTATIQVPQPPLAAFQKDASAKYISLYPALETTGGNLLNAAVQWSFPGDNTAAAPANEWSANSWNCCTAGGSAAVGAPIKVSPGQSVNTIINCENQKLSGSEACTNWRVQIAGDPNTTLHTGFKTAPVTAYGGVMELGGITKCEELPNSPSTSFTNIKAADTTNAKGTFNFAAEYGSSPLKAKCNFAVEAGNAMVKLSWQNRPAADAGADAHADSGKTSIAGSTCATNPVGCGF